MKSRISLAILLLAGTGYCLYWTYSRGGFGTTPVEVPIQLQEGGSTSVRLRAGERGEHHFEITYPANRLARVGRDHLRRISGKATLACDEKIIAEVELPVGYGTYRRGEETAILFTIPTKPGIDYVLSLQIDRLPLELAQSRAKAVVELDAHYNLLLWQIELLGVLLLVVSLLCIFPRIRRQAWDRRRPYLFMLVASTAMILLGYAGLMLVRPILFNQWNWWIIDICMAFIPIGAITFVVSFTCWFVVSVICYFRSHGVKS